jgi:hypothetical protein
MAMINPSLRIARRLGLLPNNLNGFDRAYLG